jgi:hypothetical protein
MASSNSDLLNVIAMVSKKTNIAVGETTEAMVSDQFKSFRLALWTRHAQRNSSENLNVMSEQESSFVTGNSAIYFPRHPHH